MATATLYQNRGGGEFVESRKLPHQAAYLKFDGGVFAHIRSGEEAYLCRVSDDGEIGFSVPVEGYTGGLRYDAERNLVWRLNYKELVAYDGETGEVEQRRKLSKPDTYLNNRLSLTAEGEVLLVEGTELNLAGDRTELGFSPGGVRAFPDGTLFFDTFGSPAKALLLDGGGRKLFGSEKVAYSSCQRRQDGFTLVHENAEGESELVHYQDSKLRRLRLPEGSAGALVEDDHINVFVKEERYGQRPAQLLRYSQDGTPQSRIEWPRGHSLEKFYRHGDRLYVTSQKDYQVILEEIQFPDSTGQATTLIMEEPGAERKPLHSAPTGMASPPPFIPAFLEDGRVLVFGKGNLQLISQDGQVLKKTETITEMLESLGGQNPVNGEVHFPGFSHRFETDLLRRVASEFRYPDWGRYRNSVERVAETPDSCLTVRRRFKADEELEKRLTEALTPPASQSLEKVRVPGGYLMERDRRHIHIAEATFKAPADSEFGAVLPLLLDGKPVVVAATHEGLVRVWRPGDDDRGFLCPAFDLEDEAAALSYSPDGRVFAVGDNGNCMVIRLPGKKLEGPIEMSVEQESLPEIGFLENGLDVGGHFLEIDWD